MKAEIGLWNKEQDGLWSCEWRCGAVILRPQVYRSRAGWRWRVFVNYKTEPIAQDAEEYSAAYLAACAALEHLRQWSDQMRRGCISLADAELELWNHDEDGLWSCEWRCGAVILRPQVYRSRAGWRWRVFVNYKTEPIAQDAEEYSAAYLAACAALEHLRQWSDQLHKGCISLGDNAATITEGGA